MIRSRAICGEIMPDTALFLVLNFIVSFPIILCQGEGVHSALESQQGLAVSRCFWRTFLVTAKLISD
jgi:hypothetical protein